MVAAYSFLEKPEKKIPDFLCLPVAPLLRSFLCEPNRKGGEKVIVFLSLSESFIHAFIQQIFIEC